MALQDVVKQVGETLEKEGNPRVVFGEPIKLETHVVVPVACVRLGMGAGGTAAAAQGGPSAGGGAGVFSVVPVGFIHERGEEVAFTPIHLDVRGQPFLTEAFFTFVKARLSPGPPPPKSVRPLEGQVTQVTT